MKYEEAMEITKRAKDDPKWSTSKLEVGNWFSGTSYYQAQTINKDSVVCTSKGKTIEISRDILEYEMHNSDVFSKEEKIPLTQVATKLAEANSKCFTVNFTCKVNEKDVKEKLNALSEK